MAVKLTVSSDLRGAERSLADMKKRVRNLRPPLKVIAEKFKALVDSTFLTSSDPAGKPWASLAPSTIQQKQREGYSTKPLVRRGARGLQGKVTVVATKDGIRFGVPRTTFYGQFHQTGTRRIPKRAFLPFTGASGAFAVMNAPKVQAILDEMERLVRDHVFGTQRFDD